jgi:glycosyltransferase involved in cell wall biosynthesis
MLAKSIRRWKLTLVDGARKSVWPKSVAATLELPLAMASRRLGPLDRFLRHNPRSPMAGRVFRRAVELARETEPARGVQTLGLGRAIILKRPGEGGELGYLLVQFEADLDTIARCPHLADLQQRYDVLFHATWIPYYSEPLYRFVARAPRRLLILPSSRSDYELCRDGHEEMIALPFQSSSWIHPKYYRDPVRKDIDIIMVANFSPYKRHWLLFRALRELPRNLRVVLVGVPLGPWTKEALLAQARAFGVEDRFEIHECPDDATVADLLSRARIFLGLSAREGSFISVAEALFSDTPAGLYRNAMVGSKDYINEQTGTLFDPARPLSDQILEFLAKSDTFRPAEWARAHIASTINVAKLNGLLRDLALQEGRPWTRDIEPFHCRRLCFLYDRESAAAEFRDLYQQFREEFDLQIDRP